jgi:hypothetical protein
MLKESDVREIETLLALMVDEDLMMLDTAINKEIEKRETVNI